MSCFEGKNETAGGQGDWPKALAASWRSKLNTNINIYLWASNDDAYTILLQSCPQTSSSAYHWKRSELGLVWVWDEDSFFHIASKMAEQVKQFPEGIYCIQYVYHTGLQSKLKNMDMMT